MTRKNRFNQRVAKSSYNNPFIAGAWHQLLIRLQFDTAAAERLVNNLKSKHPDKSDRWLIEKAIHDLDRDRN